MVGGSTGGVGGREGFLEVDGEEECGEPVFGVGVGVGCGGGTGDWRGGFACGEESGRD